MLLFTWFYVRKYKTNIYSKYEIKENLAYPCISSSYNYCSFGNKRYYFSCPCFPLPDNMKILRNLSKTLNNYFILLVLFIFYYPVIGIAFIFYRIFNLNKVGKNTYWKDNDSDFKKEYFESPY